MAGPPEASVDFILTDPPYLCRYRDRAGRTVERDRHCRANRTLGAYADASFRAGRAVDLL